MGRKGRVDMETEKLYYADCHLRRFSAQVTACRETACGWEVCLSATAFYPEGGGQACDLGTLGGVHVMDVRERDGEIVHLCDGALAVGETVSGEIDYARRFDLMQQHSGEHIVSGVIHARYGYANVGFHVGADVMTIDFDGAIPPEALPEIEAAANRAVWENLPVRCTVPAPETLEKIPYRTKRALPWPVRIVEIPGVDVCACCGVHVAATGEIGLIKLLSCVKFHQGVRMELVCGGRALRHAEAVYAQNRAVSQAFSAKPLETGAAARRMNEALAAEKYRAAGLEKRIAELLAASCAGKDDVLLCESGLRPGAVRTLAEAAATQCGGVAAAFSDGNFCLAGAPERVRVLGAQLAALLHGRGGGRNGIFQGSAQTDAEAVRAAFAQIPGWNG